MKDNEEEIFWSIARCCANDNIMLTVGQVQALAEWLTNDGYSKFGLKNGHMTQAERDAYYESIGFHRVDFGDLWTTKK